MADVKRIYNETEAGKLPLIEARLLLVGFNNGEFPDKYGKMIPYSEAELSNGIKSFKVGLAVGHDLDKVPLGCEYLCKFSVDKKKIRLIGVYDIKH